MNRMYSVATAVLFIFILASCTRKMSFGYSTIVPEAKGRAKISRDKNKNYIVNINVENLPEAKNLSMPRNTYVTWLEATGARTKNIGQINPSSSLFSKKMKGELRATATAKPYRIFITAEDDGNVQYPGPQMILSTH